MTKKINSKDYESWSKEELIKEIVKIRSTTYGLVWHRDLPEEKIDILVNPYARTPNEMFPNEMAGKPFPVLDEVKSKAIKSDNNKLVNLLIEGDNYHSLAVLNFTHRESIDVIYIDPPYNTGHNDFAYNDKIVDIEDSFRHSKWLSFMEKRLKLAKPLLKPSGAIFISIDDNELAQLKMLCDEIFGEKNLVGIVTVAKGTTTGQDAKRFGSSADYLLVYGMENFSLGKMELSETDKKRFSRTDDKGKYSVLQFRKTGNNDRRENRPNLYDALTDPDGNCVYPIGPRGYESTWRGDMKYYKKLQSLNMIEWIKQSDGWKPYVKYYLDGRAKSPSNLWVDLEGNKKATIELKDVFSSEKVFSNPKPTDLIKRCINLANVPDPVVLDFFAGSGTTGHAVLKMNEDGGKRSFILCTNNENKICTDICYPRLSRAIQGYKNSKDEVVDGLGGNLKYFTADFVEAEPTDKNKRKLVKESTEMLCIKENAYELVEKSTDFIIFKNTDKYIGVIYYEETIDEYKKSIKKIDGHFNTYVFSLGDDPHEKKFTDVKDKVTLCAIPEVILKVYREIFK
jgi:adenine-specific DNA-methyltransferase